MQDPVPTKPLHIKLLMLQAVAKKVIQDSSPDWKMSLFHKFQIRTTTQLKKGCMERTNKDKLFKSFTPYVTSYFMQKKLNTKKRHYHDCFYVPCQSSHSIYSWTCCKPSSRTLRTNTKSEFFLESETINITTNENVRIKMIKT